jgi:hypothetical protein
MKRYELEAMTKDQLKEHADVSGVVVGPQDTKGTMVDRILGEITTPVEAEEAKTVEKQPDRREPPLGALHTLDGKRVNGRKWRLKIFSTANDGSDVPIIVNGHNIVVKRNHEVIVDEAYVVALRNAVVTTVVQDPDTGIRVPQMIQVFPHEASPIS